MQIKYEKKTTQLNSEKSKQDIGKFGTVVEPLPTTPPETAKTLEKHVNSTESNQNYSEKP